jgi:hypothetical protein
MCDEDDEMTRMQTLGGIVRYVIQMLVVLLILASISALYLVGRAFALIGVIVRLPSHRSGKVSVRWSFPHSPAAISPLPFNDVTR